MRINHNIAALNTYRQLNSANDAGAKSMEKLSSGLRINRAGDDAAGLAISEKMRGQIRGLDQAAKNSQDGISLIQTAEGALNETHDILQRQRELAVQASNDTSTLDDRKEIQKEINQLSEEIDRIGNSTEFNTKKLLNGLGGGTDNNGNAVAVNTMSSTGLTFQIGANTNQTINLAVNDMRTTALGTKSGSGIESTASVITNYDSDAGGTNASFTLDATGVTQTTINLDKDYGSAAGVAAAINQQIQGGDYKDLLEVKVLDGGKLSFVNKTDAQVTLGDGADTELSITGAAITNSLTSVSSLKVANVDTATSGGVLTQSEATAAITVFDDAIKQVSAERSKLGAFQNRLEHSINNLNTSSENLTAAESRIRDVDYALAA
jgi:flagellin